MLRAVQASSLPAQAETEGGGGNGFLRRRQLRLLTGPSAASRSCAVRRIARAGNRSGAAAAQRAGAFTGGEGGRRPRPAPLPAPSGFSLGAAGGRSAAVGTCGANGGWSSQAAEGGRGRLGLGREGRGRSPRSPRCYCGVESGGGRPAPRRGCGEEKVAGREGTAVVAARRGGVPPPSEGPPGVPPRLLHTPPTPLPSPYPGHPASTFLSGKLGFLFLKYQNT